LRRTRIAPAVQSMSRHSSATSSPCRSPVIAAVAQLWTLPHAYRGASAWLRVRPSLRPFGRTGPRAALRGRPPSRHRPYHVRFPWLSARCSSAGALDCGALPSEPSDGAPDPVVASVTAIRRLEGQVPCPGRLQPVRGRLTSGSSVTSGVASMRSLGSAGWAFAWTGVAAPNPPTDDDA
jgi:hypothetical protein